MQNILSLFFGDNAQLLVDVEKACTRVSLKRGSRIVSEGETDETVYFILEGEARAVRYSESGAEIWLDQFLPGNLVGEMAVLGGGPRTADIYALKETTVAAIKGPSFIALMEKHGSIGVSVSRMLVTRIKQTTRRMFEQATLSSKARVYAELLRMAKALDGEYSAYIEKPPSISDLAKKLNIARETTSRTLSELKENGVIETRGRDIVITKPLELLDRLHQG